MLFPGFTPAWPRTTAYVSKTLLLSILYFQFSLLRPTFARDTGSVEQEDHNHPRLLNFAQQPEGLARVELLQNEHEKNYEPVFLGLDRSIIGRAPPEIQTLGNNAPAQSKVIKKGGPPHYWTFPKEVLFGPRAPATTGLLFEEIPRSLNYSTATGDTSIENEEIDRSKRQNTSSTKRLLYITLTTCDEPPLKTSNTRDEAPGGLELYVSMTSNNQKPSSTNHDLVVEVIGGFGAINLQASDDVFLAVAPKSEDFDGSYTYELTASIDAPFAAYNDGGNSPSMSRNDFIFFIDSDSDSALFNSNFTTTENSSSPVLQQVMDNPPPYSIFLHNEDDSSIIGVQNSLCGLKRKAQILLNGKGNGTDSTDGMNSTNGTTKMFSMIVPDGRRPAQQFHVTGLNASSSYYAIMAVEGNSTAAGSGVVRGGGTVGKFIKFKTKSDKNCALLFNLPFCSDVAYAVPSNPTKISNLTSLTKFYDDNAQRLYKNFTYSLQQIPCNTTDTARYSLARTCDDCSAAYKSWLCAVTIPRCEDFSTPNSSIWLQPRNLGQNFFNGSVPDFTNHPFLTDPLVVNSSWARTSRSRYIDEGIQPGPWKEILPCKDLCYNLTQSCPAALQFACPLEGKGLEQSYGTHNGSYTADNMACNYPGKPLVDNAANRGMAVNRLWVLIVMLLTVALASGV